MTPADRTTAASAPRRRIPLRRRLLFAVVLFLVFAGLGEVVVRIRARIKYGTVSTGILEQMTSPDPVSGLKVPTPGFHKSGGNTSISINSLGFRGQEITKAKPKNVVRIACVGASTTFCGEVSNDAATWPAQLQKTLQQHYPDVTFEVVNAGVPGYVVTQSAANLHHRVLPLDPDLVIYYEVNNDLALDTRTLAIQQGLIKSTDKYISPTARWMSEHSLLFDLIYKNLKMRFAATETADAGKLSKIPPDLPARYLGEIGKMDAELRDRHVPFVLSTYMVKYRRDQPRQTQLDNASLSFYYMPWMAIDGLLDGMDVYNDALVKYGQEHGVPVVDDRNAVPADNAHFADWAHMTDAGCILQAERIRKGLETSGVLAKIIAARKAAER